MDNSLFRWINRLANRTGWAHGFFTAYAKYGIVLFAVLLIVAYIDSRLQDDPRGVAGVAGVAGAALVALGVGLLLINRRWGTVTAVLAVVMAFTRVYVGAHYPADVLAGLALGGAVAAIGVVVVVPALSRGLELLAQTTLRVLVLNGLNCE